MAKNQTKLAPSTDPFARWVSRGNAVYLEGRAHLDGVDELALRMERKWGADRLRLLVDAEWRMKFDSQRLKYRQAIWGGDLDDVIREAGRMANAWRKLDEIADLAGADPLSPQVWETTLPNGRVVALVRDGADAKAVIADGRHVDVYTLDEIGRLIAGYPDLAKVKEVFPGATVTRVSSIRDPLRELEDLNDEIPF